MKKIWVVLVLVLVLLLSATLIAALAAGCAQKATTTEAPPITTTEAPVTTTTETQTPFEALVKKDMTAAALKNTPTIESGELVSDGGNASEQLKAEFKVINPLLEIMWVGEHNIATNSDSLNGNQFNDILITLVAKGIDPINSGWGQFWHFGGSWGMSDINAETGKPEVISTGGVAMEITDKPIIPTADGFYLEGQDPKTGALYYVRIVMGGEFGEPTILNGHDVNTDILADYAVGNIGAPEDNTALYKDRKSHYVSGLSDEEKAKFFAPGRVIYVFAKGTGGDDFFPKKWLADENNILVSRVAIILGNGSSADEINAMFN